MEASIRLLIIEDSEDDAALVHHLLRRGGYEVDSERVDSMLGLAQALDKQWDVIISDYSMPQFSGSEALRMVRKLNPEIPFIFVSGAIGEETATDAMRVGAQDYVLKTNLKRLVPAVQRELREVENRGRLKKQVQSDQVILNSIGDAVLSTDMAGHVTFLNRAAETMTGWPCKEAAGLPMAEVLRVLDATSRTAAPDPMQMADGQSRTEHVPRNCILIRRDGFEIPIELSVSPILGHQEQIIGAVTVVRDVTELKRFEHALQQKNVELEEANRMKSEFLANMSHELRTPLNSIIGFSEVLHDGLMGKMTDQQRGSIGNIFSSGNHLLSLIDDILDLSKIEAGKMILDLDPVDWSSLFADSWSVLQEMATARNVRLEMGPGMDGLGSSQADLRTVKQILYNLLSNAVKFSEKGGQLILRAGIVPRTRVGQLSGSRKSRRFPLADSAFAEFLEIAVSDGGIGISPEGLERLFLPFSQIDSGLARKFEGTGLGLAMVKLLAELHGGTVAVESTVGEGSCFAVWLPLRESEGAALAIKRRSLGVSIP